MLISLAAVTGLREVLVDHIRESLDDNSKDLFDDLVFIECEIASDIQRALRGSSLGEECRAHEMEWSLELEALRKAEQ